MLDTTLMYESTPRRLAIRGRTSNRCVMICTPLTWLRLMLFVSRQGYEPVESDCGGIGPERVEAFTEALEKALLFTPTGDRLTQALAWHRMGAVPSDTILTHQQMALRECCLAMDRDNDLQGWSSPQTRAWLERVRRFIRDEGGVRLERVP